MSGKLVHMGEKAAREMIEAGEPRNFAFDSAAADRARARGLSESHILDIFGYVPPPLLQAEPELVDASSDGTSFNP